MELKDNYVHVKPSPTDCSQGVVYNYTLTLTLFNVVENRTHFVLEFTLYSFIKDVFCYSNCSIRQSQVFFAIRLSS